MPRLIERAVAALCYLGAIRVTVVALVLPEWAFTIPSGILIAAMAWAYGRKRSPFLLHHGREGLKWAVQANLLLVALALLSKGLYYGWFYSGFPAMGGLWHFSATGFRWAGVLVSVITVFVMLKAARGETADALTVSP
ncbi:MAG TPA: hypothetical protein VD969_07660 [Symbiobacteriaceae bacterium]|nr:hypothetical protein [Symbiobacteriaceae bacterium]